MWSWTDLQWLCIDPDFCCGRPKWRAYRTLQAGLNFFQPWRVGCWASAASASIVVASPFSEKVSLWVGKSNIFGWIWMWLRPEDPNGSWRGCWGQGIGIQRHTSRRPWHEFFLHFLLLKICNTFLWSNIHLVSLYTKSSQKTLKTYFQGVMLLLSVCQLGEGRVIKNW